MKTARLIAGAVPLLVAGLLCATPPAHAGERFPVRLVDDQNFLGVPGTFTSNVPGCESGSSFTLRAKVGPGVFRGTREFVCASGIGSVTVNLSARFGDGSVGTWSIVSATGALAGAHGAGKLVGTPIPDGIQDTYTGIVTVVG